jgi:DNA-binding transcriptional LysR family regulator
VELTQVETFLALAEELHFGRTAQRLHLTQSRVSRLVAALEREVGGALFERGSRKVTLTPLGAQLRAELAPAQQALSRALRHAQATARGTTGGLRIGFTITSGGYLLNRLVHRFETDHPDWELALRELSPHHPFDALASGDVDLLAHWVLPDLPGMTCGVVLGDQPRVLAVAADSPLASVPSLSAEVLGDWPVPDFQPVDERIRQVIIPQRTPSGRPVSRHVTAVSSIAEGISLVARGAMVWPTVAAIAQLTYGQGVALVPLDDLPPLSLGLYWVTANENARIRAFADFAIATGAQPGP